jgi:putative two-component system response regulator
MSAIGMLPAADEASRDDAPVARARDDVHRPFERHAEHVADGGRTLPTLLIVDDVPANLTVLHELLRPAHRVRIATGGARALQLARREPVPDLILLDVMMPEMDGFEVLARLREDPVTRDVPVIFVTAREDAHDEERGLDLGAADYITKPYNPVSVLARVRTQLELKRARTVLADQNAALEREVARRMADNDRIQNVTIHALARLAEKRDGDTGNHIRRTQEYVWLLARQLRSHPRHAATLTDATIDAIAKSAPLHDIGKVAIPDVVLLKPGSLTAEEWAVMRTHARHGRDAIEQAERDLGTPAEFLAHAKDIAAFHHERWDGRGYPDGLAGEAIPLSARLMALADVFDALTTRRVYHEPMSTAGARDAIVAQSGAHFDPDVVAAFVECFDRFVEVARRLRDPADG